MHGGVEFSQDEIAARSVDVPNVNLQANAARDAVDGAGENVAHPGGGYSIDTAARAGRRFKRECDFRSRQKRVMPLRHQHRTRVSALAFDKQTPAGGRGDRRDDADVDVLVFKNGSLFNVQFGKGGIITHGMLDRGKRPREVGRRTRLVEREAFFILKRFVDRGVKRPGQQPAAQTADAETRRLLGSKNQQLK